MKIAITGGSGFIGTQLCTLLKAQGHEIVIIDIAPSKAFPNERLDVDVTDLPALENALQGCEAIYHLAAEHRDDVQPIEKYYDVNVEGGKNVANAAEKLGINKIIFTSTVAVYGLDKGASTEQDTPDPFNDYGHSKWQSEQAFNEWVQADPKRTLTTLRLVATFGVGNRGNIYNLLNTIASGKFIMIGNGNNHKSIAYVGNVAAFLNNVLHLNAGKHLYNYADKPDLNMLDMVEQVYKTLERKFPPKAPYIVGLLGGYVFDILAKMTGRTFPISSIRVKKFCADTVVDASKLKETGFIPPFSLKEGLKEMIEAEFLNKKANNTQNHAKAA
ncbi:MAG: UDP-N-acetylglucosamine 4-epimerase [Micavibrio sp.]|nr:UDP-N-acetylglucosamine 4-epimerase [Micavibrio sp.]